MYFHVSEMTFDAKDFSIFLSTTHPNSNRFFNKKSRSATEKVAALISGIELCPTNWAEIADATIAMQQQQLIGN